MAAPAPAERKIAIAIHGGAGTIARAEMTPPKEAAYRGGLEAALRAGRKTLIDGGTSMDAVTAAVRVMEDSPLFNAGRGSVYTADETHEMDAAVMDGRTLAAGAVAAVRRVRNPIDLARRVMDKSEHVLLIGDGAEAFATEQGVELVDASYFDTPERLEALRREQRKRRETREGPGAGALIPSPGTPGEGQGGGQTRRINESGPHPSPPPEYRGREEEKAPPTTRPAAQSSDQDRHGTVGAVALDRFGNLAAATSTGGMTNKRPGRVGDTPLIGAGTYADNETCAVSATGHGEYIMRLVVGHAIASLMRYGHKGVREAADEVVIHELRNRGGDGGVVAIDRAGHIAMPFNTAGMYRGSIDRDGEMYIAIFEQ